MKLFPHAFLIVWFSKPHIILNILFSNKNWWSSKLYFHISVSKKDSNSFSSEFCKYFVINKLRKFWKLFFILFFKVSPHPEILSKYELKSFELLFSELLLYFKEALNHESKSCNKTPFDILVNISFIVSKPICLPIALKVYIFIFLCNFLFDKFSLR